MALSVASDSRLTAQEREGEMRSKIQASSKKLGSEKAKITKRRRATGIQSLNKNRRHISGPYRYRINETLKGESQKDPKIFRRIKVGFV